jgi:hypothetical protein
MGSKVAFRTSVCSIHQHSSMNSAGLAISSEQINRNGWLRSFGLL